MNILKSLVVIMAMIAVVAGATKAIFTSTAKVEGNTFATGSLDIRINGQSSIAGFSVTNAAPGTCQTGKFDINNFGQPWFQGPSTLPAKTITMSSVKTAGDENLYNALTIKMTMNAGGTPENIWDGNLSGLLDKNALISYYQAAGLIAGSSETVNYETCLPLDADNTLQGKTATFDFVVNATSS